jgi:hypothetical protein
MLTALLLATLAAAAEPQVEVADDGAVIARLKVEAGEQQVRAAIPGLQQAGVNSNVLSVSAAPDGSCTAFSRTTRGLYRPLQLRTRFCPTSTGWREFLVSSDDFTAYEAEWTLRPSSDGGTQVQLRVKSDINLMVPDGLLRSGTIAGVKETFDALVRRLLNH